MRAVVIFKLSVMEKKQLEKMYMYEAVLQTCAKYQPAWSGWPVFVTTLDEFRALHDELRDLNALHKEPTANFAAVKSEARKRLIERYMMITGILKAHAGSTQNFRLKEFAKHSPSSIKKMREEDCGAYSREFIIGIEENLTELAPFQIDQILIDEFAALVDAFETAIATPRVAIIAKRALTATIYSKFKTADEVLKIKLSSMVNFLRYDEPGFYRAFNYAKVVVHHKGRPSVVPGAIKPMKPLGPQRDDDAFISPPEV